MAVSNAIYMADRYIKQALEWVKRSEDLRQQGTNMPVANQPMLDNIVKRHHQMAVQAANMAIINAQQFIQEVGGRVEDPNDQDSW